MEELKFGLIGLGLMGREFASAVARWRHLPTLDVRPRVVAICDVNINPEMETWYQEMTPGIELATRDYRELIADPRVEAVYVAVPHNLHEEIYIAAIEAGKHLMGEKPFGIDKQASDRIQQALEKHPEVFVRCSSEFPFFPAMQELATMIEQEEFGRVIEVEAGFLHSSDLDPDKPINWKRMIRFNGEYGCLGDLGMHACHVPFRAGWFPQNVRAILSNIAEQRPDGRGGMVPCETWDNATLFCEALDSHTGKSFPLTLKTQRICPGQKNNWNIKILGTKACAEFTTRRCNQLRVLHYDGGEQIWQEIEVGHKPAFASITGGIFEFGFSDAILQMWAAYLYELQHRQPLKKFAGCVTPEEAAYSHRLFTAALTSHREKRTVELSECIIGG